jgi:hypothetical protein
VLAEITSDMFQKAGAVPLQRVRAPGRVFSRDSVDSLRESLRAWPPIGSRNGPRRPAQMAQPAEAQVAAEEEDDDEETAAMQARLDSLKAT